MANKIENDSKYNIMLKYEKIKLHIRYISCICISIAMWVIVSGTANNPDFISQFSFASTVTSIVLSVVAIILSITGEGKTEAIRNQMTETTNELHNTVVEVRKINEDTEESLGELKKGLSELQSKIDKLPYDTASVTSEMYAMRQNIDTNNIITEKPQGIDWSKKDGE